MGHPGLAPGGPSNNPGTAPSQNRDYLTAMAQQHAPPHTSYNPPSMSGALDLSGLQGSLEASGYGGGAPPMVGMADGFHQPHMPGGMGGLGAAVAAPAMPPPTAYAPQHVQQHVQQQPVVGGGFGGYAAPPVSYGLPAGGPPPPSNMQVCG
eukprot:1161256-Pelagomonas_calceolata.AAC.3